MKRCKHKIFHATAFHSPFNVQQQADALLGYEAVKSVEYEPDVNPTRLAVVWATPRRNEGPASFDMRKAEVFINNRSSDPLNDSPCSWSCSELYRQVSQAARQGSVGDYQVITKFVAASRVDVCDTAAGVEAQMRVAAFLQPQDALYFETGGKAVAVYDYRMQLSRVPPPPPPAQDPPAPAQDPPLPPAQDPPAQAPPPPAPAQAQPLPAAPGPAPPPQAPPGGRWLDRDTNGCLNLQRIGESRQRSIELCQWDDLEALPPIGEEYQQRYKLVNDQLPKGRQWLHRAAEYRRGIDRP
ncbi:hypothetical protein QJQ45_012674 [Haematococcus lacustris]|nr:hypothetical protein QJQ45_012674 [Haematococcus lacustris]